MARRTLLSRLKRLWTASYRGNSTNGFTLLELLIATAIGAGIVAGLMFIVVQLTSTDQREASRSETQREMQMALDFISAELREAVHVYSGDELRTLATSNFLPASVTTNSVPILAFWKLQPFPDATRQLCRNNAEPAGVNCEAGASYALVVYSLSNANNDNIWSTSNARITRYILTQTNNQGNLNQGYVNPIRETNFTQWPRNAAGNNLQDGRPIGSPVTLVDYVDRVAVGINERPGAPNCPNGYNITPSNAAVAAAPGTLSNVRSFYACVSQRIQLGVNQDVVVFLRGSVTDRPGYTIEGFGTGAETLPTLETRVLARGTLGRSPQ